MLWIEGDGVVVESCDKAAGQRKWCRDFRASVAITITVLVDWEI